MKMKTKFKKIDISCDGYMTEVTFRDIGLNFMWRKALRRHEGEELVKSLIEEFAPKGEIDDVVRYNGTKIRNGLHGEPAHECWNDKGIKSFEARFEVGEIRNDSVKGEPAEIFWDEQGKIRSISFYTNGTATAFLSAEEVIEYSQRKDKGESPKDLRADFVQRRKQPGNKLKPLNPTL
jgi:hypothetical protein